MSRSSTLGLCITLCSLAPARAAIITVTSDSGGTGGPDCTLRDAVTAANTDTPTGGCPAGNGIDTIELAIDATITLMEVDNSTTGENGLASITSEITINGNGATVQRDADDTTPDFRIFHVAGGGGLALHDVSISGGVAFGQFYPANRGGGIFNRGTLILTNVQVGGNSATSGAGIYCSGGLVELINSSIVENSAIVLGGGVLNVLNGTVALNNSLVSGNSAGRFGAGIYVTGNCLVTLTDSTVSGNSANSAAGIWNYGEVMLNNSAVTGNVANSDGGGILNAINGEVTLTNSTVSGNFADAEGGGIWNHAALTVINSTISGNVGSGIFNSFAGTLTLAGSIVANSAYMDCMDMGTVTDAGYNIVEDGTCISDPTSFGGDPMLGPLEDNGGPTLTHALLESSPAIDAIPVADCAVDTDQRGVPRPQGDGCDIGAYEVEPADPCADDDGDGLVTICHVPPGNPGNAHTITVSVNALPKHLAHGDQCGPCEDELSAQRGGGQILGSNNGARSFGRTSVAPRR